MEEPGRPQRVKEFLLRVVQKADDDNIFFMAGAIAFNFVVAIVPLLLLSLGIAGFALTARFPDDPSDRLVQLLLNVLPGGFDDSGWLQGIRATLDELIDGRTGLSVVGALLLVWLSTRLVGTLRTVLREVFDVTQGRGPVRGKLYDAQMVVVGGGLALAHVIVTALLASLGEFGSERLPVPQQWLDWGHRSAAVALSFLTIWGLMVLVYRYLPARRIPWKTVLVSATFAAIALELMKFAFGWYVSNVANYRTTYGNLATLMVLFIYLYNAAIMFVLGGEVGQVYTMRRTLRLERRRRLAATPPEEAL